MLSEISDKFGVSSEDLFTVNGLDQHWQTIFPNTTLLIPFKSFVLMNESHSPPPPPPPTPMFLPTITVSSGKDSNFKSYYIAGSVVGFFLVVTAMFAYSLYVKKSTQTENKVQKLLSFNTKSSTQLTCSTPKSSATTPPCLSPDLLVGIIYSLKSYNIEELRRATNDFSQKIGSDDAYRGVILNIDGGLEPIMVKPLRFEDIRQVIDVHSRINHINIVTLVGVCYGESDAMSTSYILLELPSNGCLRDCIRKIRWQIRTQIAFDIASGLHYLHDCIFPSYAHMSVNSRNVFVTSDWRAKLTNIRITNSASEKVDIFAFGVVLLELISGREDENGDGKSFKESLGFLGGGGGGEGGCFEQLRSFMDPCLEGDYPLAEALCLAVLAKTCVEDDPLHRPSMDDILKVLVRMV
ncbi:Serine/threonine receptor-like kinase NFP [Linum grandiflorum]